MTINTICNATLDDLRIGSSEVPMAGNLTFHQLGLFIAAATALIAILVSMYLIMMHALHYTKPNEQRHIIRILFMVPVYAIASFFSFWFYWHAIYFSVLADCYEAFAIASFFALLCHYIAPNLHEQKQYFRSIQPKPWVLPINWFKKCCGGERGPWRTPRSGLTWFNIVWSGIYQYCFIMVAMTITAVLTQYFGKYCESSDSPVFAHIWILVIESVAVTIAMYMVIQFYIQLRVDLAHHKPFLKVLAIKMVIFLSFWQSFMISVLTSAEFSVLSPTAKVAYPDLKIGIPSLLLCIEMALFALFHLFAFPWKPYAAPLSKYTDSILDAPGPKQGGFLGFYAFVDAMNPWDLVKGFARGMKWLFVGRKTRESDISYKVGPYDFHANPNENDMSLENTASNLGYKSENSLPIADEFRRSKFGMPGSGPRIKASEDGEPLIAHAQPNPLNTGAYTPARQRYDSNGAELHSNPNPYGSPDDPDHLTNFNPTPGTVRRQEHPRALQGEDIGMAVTQSQPEAYDSHVVHEPYIISETDSRAYLDQKRTQRQASQTRKQMRPSEQWANSRGPIDGNTGGEEVHNALWQGRDT